MTQHVPDFRAIMARREGESRGRVLELDEIASPHTLEGVKDFMVTLVLARTNPGAISVARNALRRV